MSDNNSDNSFISTILLIIIVVFVGGIILNFIAGPFKFLLAFILGILTSLWIF